MYFRQKTFVFPSFIAQCDERLLCSLGDLGWNNKIEQDGIMTCIDNGRSEQLCTSATKKQDFSWFFPTLA
jgi:hypothetical protein